MERFFILIQIVVTDLQLPKDMVDTKELGKLKLEHKISKGIFITGKTYCFYDDKGKFHNKAKGIKSDSLRYMDYIFLLNNRNVNTAIKVSSNKD